LPRLGIWFDQLLPGWSRTRHGSQTTGWGAHSQLGRAGLLWEGVDFDKLASFGSSNDKALSAKAGNCARMLMRDACRGAVATLFSICYLVFSLVTIHYDDYNSPLLHFVNNKLTRTW
jgi:hypothetical protein